MILSHIAYYRAEDYQVVRGMFPNDPDFPNTYDEWFYLAKKHFLEEQARGHSVQEVIVNPNDFARFCNSTGRKRDRAALNAFLLEKAPSQGDHGSPFLLRNKSS